MTTGTGSTYTCTCASGYSGANCQISNIPSCANNTCMNGGTCQVNSFGLQYCICPSGFTGGLCQFNAVNCSSSPCRNGGICTSSGGSYACNCTANYYGPNCDYLISAQQCTAGDTNQTTCALLKSNGFCNYNLFYNMVPVPVYCPSSCNVCRASSNSTCSGSFLKYYFS